MQLTGTAETGLPVQAQSTEIVAIYNARTAAMNSGGLGEIMPAESSTGMDIRIGGRQECSRTGLSSPYGHHDEGKDTEKDVNRES